jgi:hypothetical protein
MKRKHKKLMTILVCELCGKIGAGAFCPTNSVLSQLEIQTTKPFVDCGFLFGPVADDEWHVHCDGCNQDNAAMLKKQAAERESFIQGQAWDVIKYQRDNNKEDL